MTKRIEKYTALIMQPHVHVAEDRDGIKRNLDRALQMIDFGVGYSWELPARLVVFPEYFLQGVTTPGKGEHGIDSFMKKAITFDGPEFKVLSDKAREYKLYIAGGGVVEQVKEFPGRWFNSAFIIGPDGGLALRYHKWHIPASIGLGTSPHDLFEEYTVVFGNDIKTLFPVIDTEIGKLGTMTCHDGCTPEVSRALGYNGAEVICHPVALQEIEGVSPPWDFWMFTRRTRAHDNMAYVLGSNWGTVEYDYYPRAFCPGGSLIIDYTGMIMREAPYPQEQVIAATIALLSFGSAFQSASSTMSARPCRNRIGFPEILWMTPKSTPSQFGGSASTQPNSVFPSANSDQSFLTTWDGSRTRSSYRTRTYGRASCCAIHSTAALFISHSTMDVATPHLGMDERPSGSATWSLSHECITARGSRTRCTTRTSADGTSVSSIRYVANFDESTTTCRVLTARIPWYSREVISKKFAGADLTRRRLVLRLRSSHIFLVGNTLSR